MSAPQPLLGTRVVDLTRFVAGSYVTMTLAALGADVVKVEVPPDGDSYRHQATALVGDESSLFLALNGGKRSIGLDLRHPDARPVIDRLVDRADFVVQNARPGSLDRYGLGWPQVCARNPRCVYAAISGYGEVGPRATDGGFDLVLQADAGIMAVTGLPDGTPVAVGAPLLDIGAGLSCLTALLAAHVHRLATGEGVQVSSSLLEFSLAGLTTVAAAQLATGQEPRRAGGHSPMFAPYGAFAAADGHVILAGAGSEHLWVALCNVLGAPELLTDARFTSNGTRVTHRDALVAEIEARLSSATVDEWLVRLSRAGVPAARVSSLGEVLASEQVRALGSVHEVVHPTAGAYRTVGLPLRFGGVPVGPAGPAPALGQHTGEVLYELGFDAAAIDALVRAHAVVLEEPGSVP